MHTRTLARPRLDGAGWVHPYSVTPFSPTLYADGGQGEGGDAPGTGQPGSDEGQTAGQAPDSRPTPTAPAPQPAAGDESTLPAWAQKALSDARAEAGKSRVAAKEKAADDARADLAQQIGRALGLVDDDQAPDPAALTQQLTTAQEQARTTAVELAVYRAAQAAGADPDALLDSRQFADAVAEVDPTDTAAVRAAIEAAVKANPKLAAPSGPPRGGAEFAGAPTAPRSAATLHDAIAARLGG
ncbi:hypothetical protein [Streptomyces cacaoi]|uniref:hypothetical protein n=1 Tax=Streptomyces cacaoi TaxID=1898 RepID=UPI003748F97E